MKKVIFILLFAFLTNGSICLSNVFAKSSSDDIGDQYSYSPSYGHGYYGASMNDCFLILFLGTFLLMIYQFIKGYKRRGWFSLVAVILISFLFLQVYIKRGVQGRLKPVIYFYSPKEQVINVHLKYAGDLTVTYPKYDPKLNGWKIKAYPDGRIINLSDQEEYSYIFWEGNDSGMEYDFSKGFVVEGDKADIFLKETLSKLGLIPREYNEFIVYWYPLLKKNKYNLIYFARQEYEKIAPLEITPKPDSLLRVFMVYKPLVKRIKIKAQEIKPFIRKGFTVVEWGGTESANNEIS